MILINLLILSFNFSGTVPADVQVGTGRKPSTCAVCKNLTKYSNSRTLHSHLLKSGFVPNYICWTKHGESGIIMDEGEEEEEELNHANIIAQYGGFNGVANGGDNEEEVAAEDDRGDDAFGDAIRDA